MSFGTKLIAAGESAAAREVLARIERITRDVEALAIALVSAERRQVVLRGANLAKRRLSDPALRFVAIKR